MKTRTRAKISAASGHDGLWLYLTETQPFSEKLLALSGPAKPITILRIAAPCEMSGCKHFKGDACTLAQ